MVWVINMCVSSNFTSPKWEAEWTEKETWDFKLCLHSDRRSKHLHHGSISNRLCFSSIFILHSSLVSGAYENPHLCLSHRSAFHGDWTSTSHKSASLSKYALEPQIIHFLFRHSHETIPFT